MKIEERQEKIFWLGGGVLFLSFFLIWARGFELTVIKGNYFYQWAQENRLRKLTIPAPRGRITSREGTVLADNLPVYFSPQGEKLSREEGLIREARGEEIKIRLQRRYPLGEAAAHLTGYLGEVTQEEIAQKSCPDSPYQPGDMVGKGGLEQEKDCFLRGKKGEKLVEVDARGRIIREIGRNPPQPGKELKLTIASRLQEFAWEKLKGKKGAIVVLDPQNGDILALVSSPSFNPNFFTWQRSEKKIAFYLNDKEGMPFLNRAISGAYHPGSVFKPIVAVAALEEKKIDAHFVVEDMGVIRIGKWEYSNWYWTDYGRTEGKVDLVKGIKRSNDIYFYRVGEKLGAEKISLWAKKFGLGEKTGVTLPGEQAGLVPSPQWKLKAKGEPWFLGNTFHLAIGQGDLAVTPLQIAAATAAIANQGQWCRPRLLNSEPYQCHSLSLKEENLALVKRGMVEACLPGGTAASFFYYHPFSHLPPDKQIGCKTGTAEVGDGSGDTHAWFVLFAPVDNPQLVVVVFMERGGSGASVSAPIAKEIVRFWKENYYGGN
ncbi:penicillin-binding protein 2 [bacterium]|nr:penicillin-binding protein 2 [bacterium]